MVGNDKVSASESISFTSKILNMLRIGFYYFGRFLVNDAKTKLQLSIQNSRSKQAEEIVSPESPLAASVPTFVDRIGKDNLIFVFGIISILCLTFCLINLFYKDHGKKFERYFSYPITALKFLKFALLTICLKSEKLKVLAVLLNYRYFIIIFGLIFDCLFLLNLSCSYFNK